MPEPEDNGHLHLLADLNEILEEAQKFEFHDFKNTKEATPKMYLVKRLGDLAQKAKDGDYDN